MAGQEVLFCSVIDQLQSPQDSLVIVLHWNLISNGFKCCGIGDEVDLKKIYYDITLFSLSTFCLFTRTCSHPITFSVQSMYSTFNNHSGGFHYKHIQE
jgi:hypothetical protein